MKRIQPSLFSSTLTTTRLIAASLALTFILLPQPTLAFTPPHKKLLIVIDPGHGGHDLGTSHTEIGKTPVHEKEVTLTLAKRIAEELKANHHQVVLTRETDQDVALADRTALANRLKADLFISLHLNSSAHSKVDPDSAFGVETYFLNRGTSRSSQRLVDLENSVLKGSFAEGLENREASLILKDLMLSGSHQDSGKLACAIQNKLVETTSLPEEKAFRNRGVKKALFYVLLGADMPSVLVEAGFLSNPRDREKLVSQDGQTRIAKAFSAAISSFKTHRPLYTCKIR